ncbi:unnamed protein product [Lactuca virosa]|uniref:Uncharacterized protein n=1 Tax=Lactuca virosa TaxID=75947 RepID=A0AAU9M401_9ASTR|nr:unnamed protein product [Lactuca virosa]
MFVNRNKTRLMTWIWMKINKIGKEGFFDLEQVAGGGSSLGYQFRPVSRLLVDVKAGKIINHIFISVPMFTPI